MFSGDTEALKCHLKSLRSLDRLFSKKVPLCVANTMLGGERSPHCSCYVSHFVYFATGQLNQVQLCLYYWLQCNALTCGSEVCDCVDPGELVRANMHVVSEMIVCSEFGFWLCVVLYYDECNTSFWLQGDRLQHHKKLLAFCSQFYSSLGSTLIWTVSHIRGFPHLFGIYYQVSKGGRISGGISSKNPGIILGW